MVGLGLEYEPVDVHQADRFHRYWILGPAPRPEGPRDAERQTMGQEIESAVPEPSPVYFTAEM